MSKSKLTGSHGCGGSCGCGCGGSCGEKCNCRNVAAEYSDNVLTVLELSPETPRSEKVPDRYAIIDMAKSRMEDRGYQFIENSNPAEITHVLRAFCSDKITVISNGVERTFMAYGHILCKKDMENGSWLNSETGENVEMRIKSHRVTVQLPGEDKPRVVLCGDLYDVYGQIVKVAHQHYNGEDDYYRISSDLIVDPAVTGNTHKKRIPSLKEIITQAEDTIKNSGNICQGASAAEATHIIRAVLTDAVSVEGVKGTKIYSVYGAVVFKKNAETGNWENTYTGEEMAVIPISHKMKVDLTGNGDIRTVQFGHVLDFYCQIFKRE